MKQKLNPRAFLTDTLYYAVGSIFYSLALYTFALHASFSPGGISGLAIIANHYTGWPIGTVSLVLNIPLIILCGRVVGVAFLSKSIWTMLINTLFLDVIFPHLPFDTAYRGNPLLAAMFTGVFMGIALAIIYMRGSSTGGADFVVMTVKKLRPHYSIGQISLAFDAVVILLGGLTFGNVDAVLYGIIAAFATTLMMDNILYGAGTSKLAIIITNFGKEIAEAISVETERGSTLVDATGSYTGQHRDMLLCVCSKSEIYKVRAAARAIDPGSMIMITEASEVIGEGFVPPNLPGHEDPAAQKSQSAQSKYDRTPTENNPNNTQ